MDLGIYPVLALAAAGMSAVNLYVLSRFLPRAGGPPNLARAIVVSYVLVASSVFWIVLPWAILAPSLTSYYTVLTLMTLPMPAPFLWMYAALFRAEERSIPAGSVAWSAVVAGGLLANELFMSVSFTVALDGFGGDLVGLLGRSLNSVWFAAPMLATMALLLVLVRTGARERPALAGLAGTVAVGPLLLVSPLAAGVLMAGLMIFVIAVLIRPSNRSSGSTAPALAVGVVLAMAGMAAAELIALLTPALGGNAVAYGAASFVVMAAEAFVLVRWGLRAQAPTEADVPASLPTVTPSTLG